jgi:exosome complex component CSL4
MEREQKILLAKRPVCVVKYFIFCYFFSFAKVQIVCVRDVSLTEPFRGQIRKEDIREFDKDRVEMYKCFRPGDVILARVLSLGEASSGYLLSTGENELGVVIAKSEHSGVEMIPVSWTEMQCPNTYNKELRKIAKVIPKNLAEKPENQ